MVRTSWWRAAVARPERAALTDGFVLGLLLGCWGRLVHLSSTPRAGRAQVG